MSHTAEGVGRRKPLRDIPIGRLHPDPQNPRLPKYLQGKGEKELLDALYKFFDISELAVSMAENGYFDAEPLVAVPVALPNKFKDKNADELASNTEYLDFLIKNDTHYTVIEGNRRLTAAKFLINREKRNLPEINDPLVLRDLQILPVIIYPDRKSVLSYLGARHIIGTKKWDSYEKASYIASLREEHGMDMDEIQKTIGDSGTSTKKIYICHRLIQIIEREFEDYDTAGAKENFSFLLLALGQGAFKDYLGFSGWQAMDSEKPIDPANYNKLLDVFEWLFGRPPDRRAVIEESRDITKKLTHVLRSADSVAHLKLTSNLFEAYDMSEGEEIQLHKYLKNSHRYLGNALPLIPKFKTPEVKDLIHNCDLTLDSIHKLLDE